MNKKGLTIAGLLIVAVLGFVAYSSNAEMKTAEKEHMMMEKEKMMIAEKEAMMASGTDMIMKGEDDGVMEKNEGAMMKKVSGMYTAYDTSKLALAKDNKVIIFFHAGWCPTCRALDVEINAKGVQEGYVILKADYDTEKALKAKYGVTSQHTLVQVDASGNQLMKWSGGDLGMIYTKVK